jgi:hypothetical protein
MPWLPNLGRCPDECAILDPETGEVTSWRNVHVRLHGGFDTQKAGHAPWPAKGGRIDTNWRLSKPTPHPFEIKEYEVQ